MLEDFFDGNRLCGSLNGNEAVASGATILVARLSEKDDNMKKDVVLHDFTPRSLGTLVKINDERGEGVKVNDYMRLGNFFFSGLTLGTNGSRDLRLDLVWYSYYTYAYIQDGDCLFLKGRSTVDVCFNLDSNEILLVTAKEISTGIGKAYSLTRVKHFVVSLEDESIVGI
nr:hypothetical protein [Tanacetum cinerariifolium]